MPAAGAIRVRGLRELNRAFVRADRTLKREKNDALKRAADPVRLDAERLAASEIPRIGVPWSRMRVGVTQRLVYVAPRERGVRGGSRSRPNLAGKLLNEAMTPALARNRERVVRELEQMLDKVGKDWER